MTKKASKSASAVKADSESSLGYTILPDGQIGTIIERIPLQNGYENEIYLVQNEKNERLAIKSPDSLFHKMTKKLLQYRLERVLNCFRWRVNPEVTDKHIILSDYAHNNYQCYTSLPPLVVKFPINIGRLPLTQFINELKKAEILFENHDKALDAAKHKKEYTNKLEKIDRELVELENPARINLRIARLKVEKMEIQNTIEEATKIIEADRKILTETPEIDIESGLPEGIIPFAEIPKDVEITVITQEIDRLEKGIQRGYDEIEQQNRYIEVNNNQIEECKTKLADLQLKLQKLMEAPKTA